MDDKIVKKLMAAGLISAAMVIQAAPSVTVNSVASCDPWSQVTVNYTLGGVDAELDYKVAFEVTANGIKKGVTNAAAKLVSQAYTKVIDTAALFGTATTDPKAKVGVSLIAVKPQTPQPSQLGGVQLWENGPYWAECNVGASKPEEYGYYFWWGDTVGYTRNADNNGWVSVKDGMTFSFLGSNCPTYEKDNAALQSAGYIDSTDNLVAAHDAATTHLGAPWRMPTRAEIDALIDNCTITWITTNGVTGRLVTGKGTYASKSVFLPAAGYGHGSGLYGTGSSGHFLSSETSSSGLCAFDLGFYLDFSCGLSGNYRYYGFSVRPVRGFAK